MEIRHGPIEQAKRLGPHGCVLWQHRMFRVFVFEMVDDRPKTGDRRAIEVDEDRQMRAWVVSSG